MGRQKEHERVPIIVSISFQVTQRKLKLVMKTNVSFTLSLKQDVHYFYQVIPHGVNGYRVVRYAVVEKEAEHDHAFQLAKMSLQAIPSKSKRVMKDLVIIMERVLPTSPKAMLGTGK